MQKIFFQKTILLLFTQNTWFNIKKIKTYNKLGNCFFNYEIRNYNDIITVCEIFSKEDYNLKKFLIYKYIEQYYQDL